MLFSHGTMSAKLVGLTIFVLSSLIFLNYHSWTGSTWAWDPPSPPPPSSNQVQETATKTITLLPSAIVTPTEFPKKIWYKLGAKGQSEDSKKWTATCLQNNPSYRVEYINDPAALSWVEYTFSLTRPDIVSAYSALKVPILQADLLRYLLLWAEGGIWMDLDVSCEDTPIARWLPVTHKEKDVSLIVGVEFDFGLNYEYERQFATWAVQAKPRSAHMMMVIDDILANFADTIKEHNTTISGMTKEMIDDVVYYTGPRRFSRSIAKSLSKVLGKNIENKDYSKILEPKLLADVLIMPGYAFATSVNTYPEGKGGKGLVTHHYAGSWKNPEGGEGVGG